MLPNYTTYLIDLDGVVYRGEVLLPGAKEFVHWLDTHHKKYLFLTNNSFASKAQVIAKLKRLSIATDDAHVMSAAQAAVQTITRRFPGGNVYVVGEPPLFELVEANRLHVANQPISVTSTLASALTPAKVDAVIVGLDRTFNYEKLTGAMLAIRAGAAFIAINRDPLLPIEGGVIPGCGAMTSAIETSSSTKAEIIGKPEPALLQEAMYLLESQPEETVMIGDGLDTDIEGGLAAHTHTIFVLSGKDTRKDLATSPFQPEHVYEHLGAVVKDLSA